MANVTFNYCSQSVFDAKKQAGTLLNGGLYFITDSGRLYRATAENAAIVYSQPFQIVPEFPATGLQGCLYIHATTHEVRTYDGSTWTVVIPASTSSNVYSYKGSCTYAELTAKTGMATGDVWNVTTENTQDHIPAGTNYAYDGTKWDPLGGSVDLSAYLTATVAASTYLTQQAASTTYLTQSAASTTYATKDVATTTSAGLMSATDKEKLDGLGSLTWQEVTNS